MTTNIFNLYTILEKLNDTNFVQWERNLRKVLGKSAEILDIPVPVLSETSSEEERKQVDDIRRKSAPVTGLMLMAMERKYIDMFIDMEAPSFDD